MRTIQARLSQVHDGGIAITYSLDGQISRLSLPAKSAPSRVDGLWQHTCFEAFVSVQGAPEYREFNFAPSGQWAAYAFQRYREGGPLPQALDPQITVRTSTDRFELDALIFGESLSSLPMNARLLLGLSAVIEEDDGVVSYWALKHPPGPPDFHHASGFVLELEPHVAAALDPAYTGKR
ncbi:MAG TPA: DOMON-like domain-containing protein [Candidatus Binatia bacterium]